MKKILFLVITALSFGVVSFCEYDKNSEKGGITDEG